jgi:hypothetical protein
LRFFCLSHQIGLVFSRNPDDGSAIFHPSGTQSAYHRPRIIPYSNMIEPTALDTDSSCQSKPASRRGVLGTMGLAGLGLLASASPAAAFGSKQNQKSIPKVSVATASQASGYANHAVPYTVRPDLPEEWEARHGRIVWDYIRYLNSLGLRRINPSQVVASHAKKSGNVWNTLPPKSTWRRMGYTLKVVERIAMELNISQVEVISAYRSPAYNARSGGKSGSWHQANVATDVRFPVRARLVTTTARELRDLGLFKGGVGGYWNFTHIDCRGSNVNW